MGFNRSDPVQRQALKTELETDPRSYGYAADIASGSDQGLANRVNLARTGITVRRGVQSGKDVMSCIAVGEYEPLTVGKQQFIIALVTPVEGVDLSNDVVRASLGACFAVGPTRTRLLAIADKTPASRGEELFGVDTNISATDVAVALRG